MPVLVHGKDRGFLIEDRLIAIADVVLHEVAVVVTPDVRHQARKVLLLQFE